MSQKGEVKVKAEPVVDLDDLLQCPVCYEIPSGQIFQCDEGHHVCGRCKVRLLVCPVCRAMFFGTRNYAMEELIANIKKLPAFKLGGKVTTGSTSSDSNAQPIEEAVAEEEEDPAENEDNDLTFASRPVARPPQPCKGLFRCLCCKGGNAQRLPSARLLNHLRYFHAPDLLEGSSDNGEYVQAWQFSTDPRRLVTALRVSDMGVFFLVIEITNNTIHAWLSMAASPWVAHGFCYTVTISGNDREAIFSDSVWSVRSCEGSLKKRGHCLSVLGSDARALIAPDTISGKVSVKRVPSEELAAQAPPRTFLRVASRGNRTAPQTTQAQDLEPFLQGLQNDVARLSRAFATLGREADALVRSENEIRSRIEGSSRIVAPPPRAVAPPPRQVVVVSLQELTRPVEAAHRPAAVAPRSAPRPAPGVFPPAAATRPPVPPAQGPLSRNARRRMRRRVSAALNANQSPPISPNSMDVLINQLQIQDRPTPPPPSRSNPLNPPRNQPSDQPSNGPSTSENQNGTEPRANKKKRQRQRR